MADADGKRVVVTGVGLVSSIGCTREEATEALRTGRSGLKAKPEMLEYGIRCGVFGEVDRFDEKRVPRRARQSMGWAAKYAASATLDAIEDSGLDLEALDAERAAVVVGAAFSSTYALMEMHDYIRTGRKSRAGAMGVMKTLNSSSSGNIATMLGLHGPAMSVSSSFAAGPDNIGTAYELIRNGASDIAWCGSTEGDCWLPMGAYFDNWGAMPTGYNDDPPGACRPYEQNRAGLVMSAGAGILQIESLAHAEARGARCYAEIVGYGSANDGCDMFRPTGDGLRAAIGQALSQAQAAGIAQIDYVNTHGTGTQVGDRLECAVLRELFDQETFVSSTKGQTGHAMAGSGGIESVLVMLMMEGGFIAATSNLAIIEPECEGVGHVTETMETQIRTALKFSVGLGGANSALIFRRLGR